MAKQTLAVSIDVIAFEQSDWNSGGTNFSTQFPQTLYFWELGVARPGPTITLCKLQIPHISLISTSDIKKLQNLIHNFEE